MVRSRQNKNVFRRIRKDNTENEKEQVETVTQKQREKDISKGTTLSRSKGKGPVSLMTPNILIMNQDLPLSEHCARCVCQKY